MDIKENNEVVAYIVNHLNDIYNELNSSLELEKNERWNFDCFSGVNLGGSTINMLNKSYQYTMMNAKREVAWQILTFIKLMNPDMITLKDYIIKLSHDYAYLPEEFYVYINEFKPNCIYGGDLKKLYDYLFAVSRHLYYDTSHKLCVSLLDFYDKENR